MIFRAFLRVQRRKNIGFVPILQRFLKNNVDNRRVDEPALRFFYVQMWVLERKDKTVIYDKRAGTTITIAELIPSKDVREYLEENGRVFTDFEKATLIYNHSEMSFIEKAAYLKRLMEQTENETLKEEIQDRLSYDELCLSRFYENNGDYIYELEVYDPEDKTFYEKGYFKLGKVAVSCGKKFQENFNITKILFLAEVKEPEECCADYASAVYFDNQGLVRGYYSLEVEWTAKREEIDPSRFENAYIQIPHPFSNGDFVRIKNNDRIKDEVCIIECYNSNFDKDIVLMPKHWRNFAKKKKGF